ncbi:MAG: AsmA family protein [Planctomycetota bacterium]|jgi:hypothetical protein|nr:AsmA family protein [Planctomycetota bacterium]
MSDEVPVKKPRVFKIVSLILSLLLLLAAAGIYFLPQLLPVDVIRSFAKDKIREMAGLDVDFAALRFGWTDGVTLEGMTVDVPARNGGEKTRLAAFDSVKLSWEWRPLLSGAAVVDKLRVDGFSARLVRDADGALVLPELPPAAERLAAFVRRASAAPPLAASVRTGNGAPVPAPSIAVEVRRVELRRGNLVFEDRATGLEAEAGLDALDVDGAALDDEFVFSGTATPYPSSGSIAPIPFSGKARLIRNLAFDPQGSAEIAVDLDGLPLGDLAKKFELGEVIQSGSATGKATVNYDAGAVRARVDGFRVDGAVVGLGGRTTPVPDTRVSATADLAPGESKLLISDLSVENTLVELSGRGWVDGLAARSESGFPWGEFDFSGRADVGGAAKYLEDGFGMAGLPILAGSAAFVGRAALPRPEGADPQMRPTLSVSFKDGRLVATNLVEGVSGEVELAGATVEAGVTLGDRPEIGATANLNAIPVRALLDGLSTRPVVMNLTGVGAFHGDGRSARAEIRLNSGGFDVPETPWAAPLRIETTETRMVFDLAQDRLDIDAANLTINGSIRAGIRAGVVTGIMAGDPNGRFDAEFSALLETVGDSFKPLLPPEVTGLGGSVRAALRAVVSGGVAELGANVELDRTKAELAFPDSRVSAEAELTTLGVSARAGLADPGAIRLEALRVDNGGAVIQYVDRSGLSFAGRVGAATLQANAALDLANSRAAFGELRAGSSGISAVIANAGVQAATVTSGVVAMQANLTPENALVVPLAASGEFIAPEIDFGVDNLVFRRGDGDEQDAASQFGRFAVKIGADGRIGAAGAPPGQASEVNLRRIEVLAGPVAAQARGQFLPDNGVFRMEYAARFVPRRIRSLLAYLNIPPDLLENAEVAGRAAWDGSRLTAMGTAKGGLNFNGDSVDPFVVEHDFALSSPAGGDSINVEVNSLNAGVAGASGEPIVSLAAHPSTLTVSRNGVQGFLDLRVNGSAGPTLQLATGLAGVAPQLREYVPLLRETRAEGVYSAWAQLKERDGRHVVLNVGGLWQGAAAAVRGTQVLSEPGKLGAAIEGSYALDTGRLEVAKLALSSDAALFRAEGSAGVTLPGGGGVSAMTGVTADLRFALGDLSRSVLAFPGLIPRELQLAGAVNGRFQAAGDASAIRLEQGIVQFSNFRARPGGLDFQIPSGAANYDATLALRFDRPSPADASPFAILRLVDVSGGRASLQGALLQGRQIIDFSTAFQLQAGALDLANLQLVVSGEPQGMVQLAGRVDFNRFDPAVDVAIGVRQMPLAQLAAELSDFLTIESGTINLPASAAATTRISFAGLTEDDILKTIRFENFNFATGPVRLHTGHKVNVELDKARQLLRQEAKGDSGDRLVTLESVTGSVAANGDGVLEIPTANPIRVSGDNTGDFAIRGRIYANHSLDLEALVAGKLERIIGFSLPNLLSLVNMSSDDQSRFMASLNRNAAAGHYKVRVRGPFDNPQIGGIPELAGQLIADITLAAPGAVIGGVLDLGRNAPEAIRNAPETLLKAPGNIGRSLGNILGVNPGAGGSSTEEDGGRRSILPFSRSRAETSSPRQPPGAEQPQTPAPSAQSIPSDSAPVLAVPPAGEAASPTPNPDQPDMSGDAGRSAPPESGGIALPIPDGGPGPGLDEPVEAIEGPPPL